MNSIAINVSALKLIWDQFFKMIRRSSYIKRITMFNVCDELSMWLIELIISSTSSKIKSLLKKSNLKNLLNIIFELDLKTITTFNSIVIWRTIETFFVLMTFFVKFDWIIDSKHCFIEIELNLLANFSDLNDLKNLLNLIFDVSSWKIESINKLIDVELNDVDLNLIFDSDSKLTATTFCFIIFWMTIVISFAWTIAYSTIFFVSRFFLILTNKVFCIWYKFSMIKYNVCDETM